MKKKRVKLEAVKYKNDDPSDPDFPVGKLTRVADFLPPPHQLAKSQATVKITIALNETSVDFFKVAAKKNKTKYQRMIRQILDQYAEHYNAA